MKKYIAKKKRVQDGLLEAEDWGTPWPWDPAWLTFQLWDQFHIMPLPGGVLDQDPDWWKSVFIIYDLLQVYEAWQVEDAKADTTHTIKARH